MNISTFFKDSKKELLQFIVLGLLAGAFNMGIIVLVNAMINEFQQPDTQSRGGVLVASFLGCLVFWFVFRRLLSFRLVDFTQEKLWEYRRNIIANMLHSDFLTLKKQRHKLQTILTEDVKDVAVASVNLVDFIIAFVTACCVFVYLAYLSVSFFFVTILVSAAGIGIFRMRETINAGYMASGRILVDTFQSYLNEIVSGFKEIKVAEEKGAALFTHIKNTGSASSELSSKAYKGYLNNSMIGQIFFYLLIAFLLAFLGRKMDVPVLVVVNYLFALLFLIGPLELIMTLIPELSKGLVALRRIESVYAESGEPEWRGRSGPVPVFETLRVEGLRYHYEAVSSDMPFQCGPIDFSVSKGEVVFISGGNGSGKTTFIHLLLSLLEPTAGRVLVNDRSALFSKDKKAYRAMFCPVFSDFFLFQELYGLANPAAEHAAAYLDLFEIDHKVAFAAGKFSTTDLSSGQRKRLALIACLLEEKPILVLDEWAADQDPGFRKKFYLEVIPLLRSKGVTIIAVTHDEAYFDQCDKRYHMDSGVLRLMQGTERPETAPLAENC